LVWAIITILLRTGLFANFQKLSWTRVPVEIECKPPTFIAHVQTDTLLGAPGSAYRLANLPAKTEKAKIAPNLSGGKFDIPLDGRVAARADET